MSTLRLGILGLGCALFALARPSAAQSVTLNPLGPTHGESGRGNNLLQSQLDHHDCVAEDQLDFPVTLQNYPARLFEVWAGAGCEDPVIRTSTQDTQCWKLLSFVPTSSSPTVQIPLRDLISGYTLAGAGQSTDDPNIACRSAFDSPGATSLSVYFMLIDPTSYAVAGSLAMWTATYKLTPPPPPDHVNLGIGSQELLVAFSYDQIPDDQTINGYQFYCEPEADTADDSDAGPAVCTTPHGRLVAGASTDDIQDLLCGSADRTATRGTIDGLTNNQPYDVAVAAIDSYDNVSVLSSVACAPPLAVVPGQAEPGSEQTSTACSFAPGHPSFPLLPSVALGLCLLRRRRPRRR
jgi:hypothetical protein